MNPIDTTRRAVPLLFLTGSLFLACSLSVAQPSVLPATAPTAAKPASSATPTAAPANAPVATPTAPPAAAKLPAAQRAEVVYSGGQISIAADDSSLNQILRDIARQTGMKITGGVADQRVYGKYGPGAPAQILADLLDGTGCNILLRESPSHVPEELVLTPRNGGPTPPSPSTTNADDDAPSSGAQSNAPPAPASQPAQPLQHPSAAQTQTAPGMVGPPIIAPGFVSPPTISPSSFPETAPPTAPSVTPGFPNSSNPQSPNGVGTPQQIYQQQQQMQH